jgi:putative transposase
VVARWPAARLVAKAPLEVSATRLEAGRDHGSSRTMSRRLAREGAVRERRRQRRRAHDHTPERLATGPHQGWSWEITQLKGPVQWSDDDLAVILALSSRDGVGWLVAQRASAALAHQLRPRTGDQQGMWPGQ